ncbi:MULTISPECIES: primosomal protein N' [unclassified Candidatus Frackibacter]|uniref:primosomal protein N' n=1 Tax=unclassified Candidatus Frackibacter TaxID=2648818 RepID=UPI00087E379D|nr:MULTISPECIES: primosomal protein N' [unclassified Candidatus Frackibacter]SDC57735.1 replication restart DNA helicase PriA [Candidatus Frackibacter sp. WG11]SEM71841.1 replication restart DNA helicase PriA [Candidatus Frackibacter sp. WG12]SFL82464.1 replication restart DNA helicase PriA [Candidatus Frackibacter sp. WG13]
MQFKYAKVVVDVPVSDVDKPFTYLVPMELRDQIEIGYEVEVPFGHRNLTGYVVGIKEELDIEIDNLKEIVKLKSSLPLFNNEILALAKWISEYYQSHLITVLKAVIPSGHRNEKEKRIVRLSHSLDKVEEKLEKLNNRAYKQKEVLRYLLENQHQNLNTTALAKAVDTSSGTIRRLHEKGLITYERMTVKRTPYSEVDFESTEHLELTSEQQIALDKIEGLLKESNANTMLLKGVTGSGKTEIYLQAIDKTLHSGQEAIVLVPEISLTPQTVERFKSRFGSKVAIYHSRLSEGERYDEWLRMKKGKASIVVGARSAIFAPFNNLGLIIIDEEHETSYKQSTHPKYQTRDVANKRAELNDALTVLGTATPSLESYYQVQVGNYKFANLDKRVDDKPLPPVEVIDMREELKVGNKSMFSNKLAEAIEDRLVKNEQIIIFLNRRGFSTFVLCRECGFVLECPNCDVSLTYHADQTLLRCHYCDYQREVPDICPECESRYIKYFGVGTQKVEKAIRDEFPTARLLRMDVDTTTRKGAHQRMIDRFKNEEVDILLGTQMIAKGHDFPKVTLVGVITADTALNFPDFRAAEHTFQLLTQVAGRTGRGEVTGEVIIQTYTPEHYSIQLAKEHDYEAFYELEINFRRELRYPPLSHLINLIIKGEEEVAVSKIANQLGVVLEQKIKEDNFKIDVLGPVPAPLSKLRGEYRWQIILKGDNIKQMRRVNQRSIEIINDNSNLGSVTINVDVDPIGML